MNLYSQSYSNNILILPIKNHNSLLKVAQKIELNLEVINCDSSQWTSNRLKKEMIMRAGQLRHSITNVI